MKISIAGRVHELALDLAHIIRMYRLFVCVFSQSQLLQHYHRKKETKSNSRQTSQSLHEMILKFNGNVIKNLKQTNV